MNEKRSDQILDKCAAAKCKEAEIKRHHQLFVFERWDVHPPADFVAWWEARNSIDKAVTAWNVDVIRQEFYQWRGTHTTGQLV